MLRLLTNSFIFFCLAAQSNALRKSRYVGERRNSATFASANTATATAYGDEGRGELEDIEDRTGRRHFDTGRSPSRADIETRLRRRSALRAAPAIAKPSVRFEQIYGRLAVTGL